MGLVVAASIIAFLTTEMDSLAVMLVLFCGSDTCMKKVAVVLGRYSGLALLILGCFLYPDQLSIPYIKEILALLGFIPIILGIFTGLSNRKNSVISVLWMCVFSVLVTLANGGDNISLYISFFSSLGMREFYVFCFVFFLVQCVFCVASLAIVNVKSIKEYIEKAQYVLIPFLYIVLGLYILLAGGTFMWMFGK